MTIQKSTINFVISSLGYGGQEKVLLNLANHYSVNQEVHIFTNDFRYASRLIGNNNIKIINYKNSIQLYKFLKNKSVMFFGFGHKIFTVILLKAINYNRKNKIYLRFSENKYERKSIGGLSLFNLILSDLTLTLYDHLVVQNSGMKSLLISDYAIDKQKIKVIPNPVQDNYFSKIPLGVCNHLLFIGRLIEKKGILDFLRLIIKLGDSVTSTIIGDGPLRSFLEEEICKLKKGRVEYLPATNRIDYYLSKSTILILPSYSEGSPNVIIEACAVGIPSIAYDCLTGPREIIINNINGFIIELGNEEQLCEMTKKALKLKWNVREIKDSVSHHNIDIVAKQYESIIRNDSY